MDIEKLQTKLLAIARATPPDDRVPYAFEQRVMAHLRAAPRLDRWGLWANALWRAAMPCLGLVLLLGAWTLASSALNLGDPLGSALENTIFASVDTSGESW